MTIKGTLLLNKTSVLSVQSKKARFGHNFDVDVAIMYRFDINLSVLTPKRHFLEWFHVFWATARGHLPMGLTCRQWREKGKKVRCYISPLARSPRWTHFYKSWYGGTSPGRSHVFTFDTTNQWIRGFDAVSVRGRRTGWLVAVNTGAALQLCSCQSNNIVELSATCGVSADWHTSWLSFTTSMFSWPAALKDYILLRN